MQVSSAPATERRAVFADWQPQRVAILPGLELGDLLCAVPAFRALRASLPEAHIALLGLLWARELIARFPRYVNDFVPLPGADSDFDLVIRMDGPAGSATAEVAGRLARKAAGYVRAGSTATDPDFFVPYPEGEPEIRRHLKLVSWLGAQSQGEALEFPVTAADREALAGLTGDMGIELGRYVCLCPGSRSAGLRWPPDRFAGVGDCLVRRGLQVVIIGPRADVNLTRQVAGLMKESAVDLGGRTRLGALAALLAGSSLLVANDSAVAHLAEALKVPSVLLFAPSELHRWGPLDRNQHRVLSPAARMTPNQVMRCAEPFLGLESLRSYRSSRAHQVHGSHSA
ncbi:MAG: glycosyltransferase family 9 protein [Gemmatimonadetes bacterium]|nr:glycosyltransferase family 9 protein [Gemmatimonadota bacterium]